MANQYMPRRRVRLRGYGLKALEAPLTPSLSEIGIDKLRFTLTGTWAVVDYQAGRLHELVAINTASTGWFRQPHSNKNQHKLSMLQLQNSTLSEIAICIHNQRPGEATGLLRLEIGCNPTRTLHHLLAQKPATGNFIDWCDTLSPYEFFTESERHLRRSIDGNDNWLSNPEIFYGDLTEDCWPPYLNIFFSKLADLVSDLLLPTETSYFQHTNDQSIITGGGFRLTLQWPDIRLAECETYFERRTPTAMASMRAAAVRAITAFENAEIARYTGADRIDAISREGSAVSIRQNVSKSYLISIYAKDRGLVRFEVRKRKGLKYPSFDSPVHPTDTLKRRIQFQREAMPEMIGWESFLVLFAPTGQASAPLLCEFVDHVLRAGEALEYYDRELLNSLLTNGSVPRVGNGHTADKVLEKLTAQGILVRSKIRQRRDVYRRFQRLSVAPRYLPLVDAFSLRDVQPSPGSDGDGTE